MIMSVATGLAFPYLLRSRILALSSLLIALLATFIAHVHWAASMRQDGTTGHMFHYIKPEAGIWT